MAVPVKTANTNACNLHGHWIEQPDSTACKCWDPEQILHLQRRCFVWYTCLPSILLTGSSTWKSKLWGYCIQVTVRSGQWGYCQTTQDTHNKLLPMLTPLNLRSFSRAQSNIVQTPGMVSTLDRQREGRDSKSTSAVKTRVANTDVSMLQQPVHGWPVKWVLQFEFHSLFFFCICFCFCFSWQKVTQVNPLEPTTCKVLSCHSMFEEGNFILQGQMRGGPFVRDTNVWKFVCNTTRTRSQHSQRQCLSFCTFFLYQSTCSPQNAMRCGKSVRNPGFQKQENTDQR